MGCSSEKFVITSDRRLVTRNSRFPRYRKHSQDKAGISKTQSGFRGPGALPLFFALFSSNKRATKKKRHDASSPRRRSNRGRHGADSRDIPRVSDELGSLGASVRGEAPLGDRCTRGTRLAADGACHPTLFTPRACGSRAFSAPGASREIATSPLTPPLFVFSLPLRSRHRSASRRRSRRRS